MENTTNNLNELINRSNKTILVSLPKSHVINHVFCWIWNFIDLESSRFLFYDIACSNVQYSLLKTYILTWTFLHFGPIHNCCLVFVLDDSGQDCHQHAVLPWSCLTVPFHSHQHTFFYLWGFWKRSDGKNLLILHTMFMWAQETFYRAFYC